MDPAELRLPERAPDRRDAARPRDPVSRRDAAPARCRRLPRATWPRRCERLDYAAWRAEQARARADGRLIGIGLAGYIEGTGVPPVRGGRRSGWTRPGGVIVSVGPPSQGQGHETDARPDRGRHPRRPVRPRPRRSRATRSPSRRAAARSPAGSSSWSATPSPTAADELRDEDPARGRRTCWRSRRPTSRSSTASVRRDGRPGALDRPRPARRHGHPGDRPDGQRRARARGARRLPAPRRSRSAPASTPRSSRSTPDRAW